MLNHKELTSTYDINLQIKVCRLLEQNNIGYKIKVVDRNASSISARNRSRMGSFEEKLYILPVDFWYAKEDGIHPLFLCACFSVLFIESQYSIIITRIKQPHLFILYLYLFTSKKCLKKFLSFTHSLQRPNTDLIQSC